MNKSLIVKSTIVLVITLAVGVYLASFLGFASILVHNSYATGSNDKVTICHATESDENPWTRIVVSENAIGGHFENPGTPLAVHEDDLLFEGEVECPESQEEGEEEEEELQPEFVTGSVTVCKIVVNDEGIIGDGEGAGSSFEIAGIEVIDHETVPDSAGILPTSAFTTPLTLNTDLIGDSENDAECVTYSDLELGSYFYDEEVVSGDNWNAPTYNDQISVAVDSLGDFFVYSGELFTEDASDDSSRDKNADGHIVLTESRPDRTLVVLNTFIQGEEPTHVCSDGIDNDEDGLTDSEDPGCHTDGDPENPDSFDPEDDNEVDDPTETQCSDGSDNDEDGLIDSADPGCHTDGDPENPDSFDPEDDDETDENGGGGGGPTDLPECSDGIDNEPDGDIDSQDRNCHTDQDASNPDSYDPNDDSEFGLISGGGFVPIEKDEGEVLGEETTCGVYLFEFIRLGEDNNPTEVMKLETFLNEYQGENLPVDGFYSQEDFAAVERFQVDHWENVLAPWVPHGLSTVKTPTGYVYKTTMRWINVLKCPSLELELPVLP